MTTYHEVLRRHLQLQQLDLRKRDAEFDQAVAAEKREGETPEQATARMFREDHPAIRKHYGYSTEVAQ